MFWYLYSKFVTTNWPAITFLRLLIKVPDKMINAFKSKINNSVVVNSVFFNDFKQVFLLTILKVK